MARGLAQSLRSLLRDRGFTVANLLTLALGIGATTAVFSVVHGVLLDSLPYPAPDRLVRIWETDEERDEDRGAVSLANLEDWRSAGSFSDLAGYRPNFYNLTGGDEPVRVIGAAVTPGFFRTLRISPRPGRAFDAGDAAGDAAPVVIVSERLWRTAFGAGPLLGTTIRVEGSPRTVVGIAPSGFHFPDDRFDLWLPWTGGTPDRSRHQLQVVGRLAPGVELSTARQELKTVAAHLAEEYEDTNHGRSVALLPLREALVGEVRPVILTLFGSVVLVLLIGCANVGNLVLARSIARQDERALRLALGGTRGHLVRQALYEGLLLAVPGALVGLALARSGLFLLRELGPELPRADAIGLDLGVAAFAVGVAVLAAVAFAILPNLSRRLASPARVLRTGLGRGRSPAGGTLRRGLVVAQVAVAFVLLMATVSMIRGFQDLQAVDAGFRPDGVLKMEVSLPLTRYPEVPRMVDVFQRVLARVESLPGVEAAALASSLPMSDTWASRSFVVEGAGAAGSGEPRHAAFRLVTPGYFETLAIPVRAGRVPSDGGGTPGLVVNEALARRVFPDGRAVGRRISFSGDAGPWWSVEGVVADVLQRDRREEVGPEIYQPLSAMPWPWPTLSLVVRAPGDPLALADSVRRRVWEVDDELPLTDVAALRSVVDRDLERPRFTVLVMGLFAVAALLLAAIGIYGVMAYAVECRTHEIGVRVALGGGREQMLRMILGSALGLATLGLVAGAALGGVLLALLRHRLFGVEGLDPVAALLVVVVLAGTALGAAYLPARRAMRIQPLEALRQP